MFVGSTDCAVRLAMFAIVFELTVSANLLTLLGVPYVSDGGNFLLKLHPGTHLLILSFFLLAARRGGWSVIASHKTLAAFLGFLIACLFYSLVLTGTGNLVVLLDTFLPAGLLAVVLSRAHPPHLFQLRFLMQSLLAANALLALSETAVHATLIPLYLNDASYQPHTEDFRPTALFDHPLTGSVMAMLGLALAPRRSWYNIGYCGLMWAALLAFGGRVGLAVALLMTVGCQAAHTGRMILRGHPQAAYRVAAAALVLTGAALLAAIAGGFGLGTRLAGHLYWDDSAQVRLAQWQLLDQLDRWQLLFGTRREDLLALLVPLRLATGVEVIENFWLLMFVSLGLFGFPLFVFALWALVAWCWRRSLLQARLLLVGVLLVASTSNSIGRKSTILVCTVAAIACMPVRPDASIRRTTLRGAPYRLVSA